MLLLDDVEAGSLQFTDHAGGPIRYWLPERLELATGPGGEPDFFLLRHADDAPASAGGLLRMALRFAGAPVLEEGTEPRRVPFETARFRLQVRAGTAGIEAGDWHELGQTTGGVAVPAVHLSPLDTQLLSALLSGGSRVLEVGVELTYLGLRPGLPWLVGADGSRLADTLAALLPDEPVAVATIVAAFLSLPPDLLSQRPLEDAVQPPGEELVRTELAWRGLDLLFGPDPGGGYRLRPGAELPAQFAVSLRAPRLERRAHRLAWSVAELHDELTDPEERRRYFPVVGRVSPFARTTVYVVNELPLDPEHLRSVRVDLRYPGPTGVPAHTTVTFPGAGPVASFEVVHPALTVPFELAYRVTSTLAPAGGTGWPRAVTRAMAPVDGLVVQVNPRTAGLDVVRVEIEPAAFAKCSTVDVDLRAPGAAEPLATVELTPLRTAAAVALPGVDPDSPLEASRVAHPPPGVQAPPHTLADGPVTGRQVRVQAADLEVLEPDRVTVALDAEAGASFAYVGVQLRPPTASGEGTLLTLEPGVPRGWTLLRDSVFEPLAFAYRLHLVPIDPAGRTLPLVVTEWRQGEGTSLLLEPEPTGAVVA